MDKGIKELLKDDPSRIKAVYVPQSMKNSRSVHPDIYGEMLSQESARRKDVNGKLVTTESRIPLEYFPKYAERLEEFDELAKTADGKEYADVCMLIQDCEDRKKAIGYVKLKQDGNEARKAAKYSLELIAKKVNEDELLKSCIEKVGLNMEEYLKGVLETLVLPDGEKVYIDKYGCTSCPSSERILGRNTGKNDIKVIECNYRNPWDDKFIVLPLVGESRSGADKRRDFLDYNGKPEEIIDVFLAYSMVFTERAENEYRKKQKEIPEVNDVAKKMVEIQKDVSFMESITIERARKIEEYLKDLDEKSKKFNVPIDKFPMTDEARWYIALVDREKLQPLLA